MDKNTLENLREGVEEMRSVAFRLTTWADQLERGFLAPETRERQVGDAKPRKSAEGETAERQTSEAARPADAPGAEPPAAKKPDPALTLPQVRSLLAAKCAAGFAAQVKALIESFGVSALKEVPPEHYAALVAAAEELGREGEPDA